VTGHLVSRADFLQPRVFRDTAIKPFGAAAVKPTARREVHGTGGLAFEDDAGTFRLGIREGDGGMLSKRFPQHRCVAWDSHPAINELTIPGVSIVRVDITREEEVPDHTFDRIFCLDVLEHIERLETAISVLRHLLSPQGRLIVSEPTESFLYRLGRLAIKGTFSQESGPGAGPHYHTARGVHVKLVRGGFERLGLRRLPLPWPADLFHLSVYRPQP